jgi:hypothetical protein
VQIHVSAVIDRLGPDHFAVFEGRDSMLSITYLISNSDMPDLINSDLVIIGPIPSFLRLYDAASYVFL